MEPKLEGERRTLAILRTRVYAPRHASDETDALRYLNAHGLRFSTFDDPTSALLRAERVRILKRSIPWAPADPLPHGRRWDYLAEAIPESIWSNWTPDRSLVGELSKHPVVAFVFEGSRVPAFAVDTSSLPEHLGVCDLHIMPWPDPDCVWVMNHEEPTPCLVDSEIRLPALSPNRAVGMRGGPPIRSVRDAVSFMERNALTFERQSPQSTSGLRRRIATRLRSKGIYFPLGRLNQSSSWDCIWNYLPPACEMGADRAEAIRFALGNTESVRLLFESRNMPAFQVESASIDPARLERADMYLLGGVKRDWMLSLPEDDFFAPCYVWLK